MVTLPGVKFVINAEISLDRAVMSFNNVCLQFRFVLEGNPTFIVLAKPLEVSFILLATIGAPRIEFLFFPSGFSFGSVFIRRRIAPAKVFRLQSPWSTFQYILKLHTHFKLAKVYTFLSGRVGLNPVFARFVDVGVQIFCLLIPIGLLRMIKVWPLTQFFSVSFY